MLWLGANVMLEYDIDDADGLLSKNRTNAITSLEDVKMQLGRDAVFLTRSGLRYKISSFK